MTMKKKKVIQLVTLLSLSMLPLLGIVGCGFSDSIRCSACGDNDTRLGLYASGTENDIEYKSCVGPAGILGFGCDTSCWPTECLKVKSTDGTDTLSGCIYYYNDWGCIGNSAQESKGKYSDGLALFGISCSGEDYKESVTKKGTSASVESTCLGIGCRNKQSEDSRDYNSQMPRQFEEGCWSCNGN